LQIINKKNKWPKDWGQKTSIMGVINLTPDSFSDGGELNSSKKVLDLVNHFLSYGVDVIDLGAQSTRPGAEEVGPSIEIKRLIPYLKLIKSEFPDVLISIDTFNSEVAYEALLNGANWINDVTGGRRDINILDVVSKFNCPFVITHSRGNSQNMNELSKYKNILSDVKCSLENLIKNALEKNISKKNIIVDPGIVFSKDMNHNLQILRNLDVFKKLNLDENKIAGVIFVNPSYHGYAGDLEPLIDCCHQKNLPVLVDEAHGSYFLFCENLNLPKPALSSKADLVVNSLHKSLNGLTQTAALWYKGNLINEGNLIKSINLQQTTSPSSLLLSSCEESIRDWLNKKSLSKYKKRILEAKSIYKKLIQKNIPLIETQDPLKIVLNTSKAGIDGFTADKFFYKNGLIAELPEMMTLTFCLGFGNQKDFLNLFEKLWNKLLLNSKNLKSLEVLESPFKLVQAPEIEIGIAWRSNTRSIPFSQSLNKISGDIICPYPPGIPLLVPGEKVDLIGLIG